ncbi:hypothetical protein FE257_011765 [Aspergillus nanangensis]|uniref:Bacteriophage T5 Orf172 DNA-binding domain-containing protein n=1 Tax=Aspergillus nanangensis TaxID=2582783 RepID=A0AAD4CVN7_ASPNN|nr:hypothetical protein FE257_011765 [Aspergillus nanangensis]
MSAELDHAQRRSSSEADPGMVLTPPGSPVTSRVAGKSYRNDRQEIPYLPAKSDPMPITPPASPQKTKSLKGDEIGKENTLGSSTIGLLKHQLDVPNRRCGATTQKGEPCQMSVSGKMAGFHELSNSMANMPLSSQQMENKLNELVSLTLCKTHQNRTSCRLAKVLNSFPIGSDINRASSSVTTRIKHVVPEVSITCFADKQNSISCIERIGGGNVQTTRRVVNKITEAEVYSNDARLQECLELLEKLIFCSLHGEKERTTHVRTWTSEIQAIRSPIMPISTAPAVTKFAFSLQSSQDDVSCLTNIKKGCDYSSFIVVDQKPPNYIKKIRTALRLKSPLEGHVYVYEVQGNPEFVKVGYTSKTVQERIETIGFRCNRKVKEIYPVTMDRDNKIKSPELVEALCHAQLRNSQVTINCDACLGKHYEWFRVSPTEAIDAIQKWSSWMKKVAATSTWREKLAGKVKVNEFQDLGKLLKELEGEIL